MKLKWLGHASFLITSNEGYKIITDPYQSGSFGGTLRYGPIKETADVVTVSHNHVDHGYTRGISGKPQIVSRTGTYPIDNITIKGIATAHDAQGGNLRGENVVFVINVDDLAVCHLGDLGHLLSDDQLTQIAPVNVLLIPVGGTFTIDAEEATTLMEKMNPKITIPMHYRNPRCGFNIDTVDTFLAGKTGVRKVTGSEIEISVENLPPKPQIIILEPAL